MMHTMRTVAATFVFALSAALIYISLVSGVVAQSASPLRAMELYGNHCTGCHESTVHMREKRKAKSLAQVEVWVRRWASVLKLGWDEEEVKAVADYLNSRYYQY